MAINLNGRDYYVTGITRWDDGREREFDDWKHDPIVCPAVHRYGPEVTEEIKTGLKQFWKLPKGMVGYTITWMTCEQITADEHERENARAEAHAYEQLKKTRQ